MSQDSALLLAEGLYRAIDAKTSHGLVRGPSRFPIAGILDSTCAGRDAGEVLDGKKRGIPIFASLEEALQKLDEPPKVLVIGIATAGGYLPDPLRQILLSAARHGMTLVNGLHRPLSEDAELAQVCEETGGRILDIRQPKLATELRFWNGEVLSLPTPRLAVLGIDCAVGKRTTASLLARTWTALGRRTEVIYTGQTGWLQGFRHGFIFDATLNDFVSGELEGAILRCAEAENPDVILLEGQSSLRNPTGPAGTELLLSGDVHGVILQHMPGRTHVETLEELGYLMPEIGEEVQLIRLLGREVWAVTLNEEGLENPEATRRALEEELNLPVFRPLAAGGIEGLINVLETRLAPRLGPSSKGAESS